MDTWEYVDNYYNIKYTTIIYEIDRKTNSIKEVRSDLVNIFPRLAHRNDNITIETGEANAGKRCEVVVTAMDGRIIEHRVIPAGETKTQINASRFGGGAYNFTVYSEGRKLDNGKIIIR